MRFSPRSKSNSTSFGAGQAAQPSPGPLFLGFDTSIYPGDTKMLNFFTPDTPFYFTGFYLAPAPAHSDTSWMNRKTYLEGVGYGFLIIYVGRQSTNLTYARGQTDGDNAVDLAIQAGFTSAVIYLDVESGPPLSQDLLNYIDGWLDKVNNYATWHPGIYCSYLTAGQIKNLNPNMSIRFWVWRISPPASPGCTTDTGGKSVSDSGVSYASSWQYAQNCTNQTWNGSTISPIDLNMSTYQNPSAP